MCPLPVSKIERAGLQLELEKRRSNGYASELRHAKEQNIIVQKQVLCICFRYLASSPEVSPIRHF